METSTSTAKAFFLILVVVTSVAIGVGSALNHAAQTGTAAATDILSAGTSFTVTSSMDCVASHYSAAFYVPAIATLTGGFMAKAPGVTAYVATADDANTTFQGHPSNWVYTTGLATSAQVSIVLSPGSYVLWVEGADENCGSEIVTPLEMLTTVNITESVALSPVSTGGLLLRLQLNGTSITSGSAIQINVSDYNPSSMALNLTKETDWGVSGLSMGSCLSQFYPFGIAVLQGRYSPANVSQGTALRIFPAVPCPLFIRYITGYVFYPMSDNATILPGTGWSLMAKGVSVSGAYSGAGLGNLSVFVPGTYTVVAGDEWGNLAFSYFVVTLPSSTGAQTYTYPSSNLTSSISTSLGETFVVQLNSSAASTGYDWTVVTSAGVEYLGYQVVSSSALIGGPQTRDYFFRAQQTGNQTITLRDERPWAPYQTAATINLLVTVS